MAESGNPPSRTPDLEILERIAALEVENEALRARLERVEMALSLVRRALTAQVKALEGCGEK